MALAAPIFGAGGCDSCDGPPKPPAADGDASVLDLAPVPKVEELDAVWAQATEGLEVKKGEAFEIRYAVPKCSLRYELRYVVLAEVADGREPTGLEVVAPYTANPDTDRLTWQLGTMRTALLKEGEREKRDAAANQKRFTPALVHTDGKVWKEDHGPSTLWRAHSVVPPLSPLFPELDPKGEPVTWKNTLYPQRTTEKVEARLVDRPDAGVPNLSGTESFVDLRLRGFFALSSKGAESKSVNVAVLDGTWTTERRVLDPQESVRAEQWRGRWAISDTGRVLHAVMMAGRYQWWRISERERNSKVGSAEVELRLLEDCNTLTLQPFPTK